MSIGQRIRDKRKDLKLSRVELSRVVGISSTAMQKIEDGRTKNPKHLIKIASVLQVNPAWLQFGGNIDEETNISLNANEIELISKYRQLNEPEKKFINKCLSGLLNETFKNT